MKFDTVSPYYAAMINNSYLNPVNSTFSGQSYQVADGFGTGMIHRILLGKGLDMSWWERLSTEKLQFADLYTNQEVLEISFCLTGMLEVTLPERAVSYTVTEQQVLFYYHKNFLASFILRASNYSGFSIHIHRDYIKQLLAPACKETLQTEWQNNMQHMFQSDAMCLEGAPLRLQMMAKRLEMPVLVTMDEHLSFQAKVMEFVSSCLQFGCNRIEAEPLGPEEWAVVDTARQYLLLHLQKPPSIKELARYCNTNSNKLQKDFKRAYYTTIYTYIKEQRLLKSQELLKTSDHTITEVAGEVGYANASKFASAFKTFTGVSPREYKKIEKEQ